MPCRICGSLRLPERLFTTQAYLFYDDFTVGRCLACSVRMVMDPPGDLSSYYASEPMRLRANPFYQWAKGLLLSQEVDRVPMVPGETNTVLDLGCGFGEFSLLLFRKGFSVTAADAYDEPPGLIQGLKNVKYLKINYGDIVNSLPQGEAPRIVIMRHVLEHLHDPVQFLRSLLDRGVEYLYIVVPNHDHPLDRLFGQAYFPYDVPRHLWFFDKNSLQKAMDLAGLKVIFEGYDTIPMLFSSFFRYLCLKRCPPFLTDIVKPGSLMNTLSFPLDIVMPCNARWVVVRKVKR